MEHPLDRERVAAIYHERVLEEHQSAFVGHALDEGLHGHLGAAPLSDARADLLDHFKLSPGVRYGAQGRARWLAHRHRA